jgi:catechol 2,3-dioxygenase-like lactoylglutathione lyase family enzyme
MPEIAGLLETALYADDIERAAAFYEGVLGLVPMVRSPRLVAFDAGRQGVLLVFQRGATLDDVVEPGGTVPAHDGHGPLHMAFAIAAEALDPWREHLTQHGVAIVAEMRWRRGGHSLYFHDPEGHVIELATPGLWPNY